jgi:hypothetical protein
MKWRCNDNTGNAAHDAVAYLTISPLAKQSVVILSEAKDLRSTVHLNRSFVGEND